MATVVNVVGQTPTTATTVDFTSSGFGTPVGCMVFCTWGTVAGTIVSPMSRTVSFTDFTTIYQSSSLSEDNSTNTDIRTWNTAANGQCIRMYGPTDPTIEIEADTPTTITDGVRINFTTVDATNQYQVLVVLFKDVSLDIREHNSALTAFPGSDSISGLSFTPKGGLSFFDGQKFGNITIVNFGAGAFSDDGADSNYGLFSNILNNQNPSLIGSYLSDEYSIARIDSGGTLLDYGYIETYVSDGYDITYPADEHDSGLILFSDDTFCGVYDTPTSTGNTNFTWSGGIDPDWVFIIASNIESINTGVSSGQLGSVSLCSITSSNQYSICTSMRDGVSPTEANSLFDNRALTILDADSSATLVEASFVSLASNTLTLNFTKVHTSAKKIIIFGIGTASAGSSIPSLVNSYRRLRT